MSYTALIKHTRVYQEAREEEATDAIFRMSEKKIWARLVRTNARANTEFTLTCSTKVD